MHRAFMSSVLVSATAGCVLPADAAEARDRTRVVTHVHRLSKVRPDAGGDGCGSARRAGLRALRAMFERVQCVGAPHGRSPGCRIAQLSPATGGGADRIIRTRF